MNVIFWKASIPAKKKIFLFNLISDDFNNIYNRNPVFCEQLTMHQKLCISFYKPSIAMRQKLRVKKTVSSGDVAFRKNHTAI